MKKIFFIVSIIILVFLFFYLTDDTDFCLDTGICKENQQINTEHGLILINQENCIKYGWEWNIPAKTCKLKK